MKDPAFLFYASDFLGGVSDLTMEERGQYITLLCLQQQKGHLSRKVIGLCLGFDWDKASEDLRKKFVEDEDGLFYNYRLETEIEKRRKFTDKQRDNGKKGGRPKNPEETQTKPIENPNDNPNETLLENRNRNRNRNRIEVENIDENERGGTGERENQANSYRDVFDEFRKAYPGMRRGLDTEFSDFQKKHKDWREVAIRLPAILDEQKRWRNEARQHLPFVPDWPHLKTWLYQRRWDDELNFNFHEQIASQSIHPPTVFS
jgi:uncharacterized protein YdaU (DUF1376 family)